MINRDAYNPDPSVQDSLISFTTMATTTTTTSSSKAALFVKNDNDVVIVAAVRSAMTKVGGVGCVCDVLRRRY